MGARWGGLSWSLVGTLCLLMGVASLAKAEDGGVAGTRPAPAIDAKVLAERDRLLVEADRSIRQGLLQLVEKYPQLKQTAGGPLAEVLARPSPAGAVFIRALSPAAQQGGHFNVLVAIRPVTHSGPMHLIEPSLYPHLNLGGQISISATDANLEGAIKQTVEQALAPLEKLDASAGASTRPSTRPAAD